MKVFGFVLFFSLSLFADDFSELRKVFKNSDFQTVKNSCEKNNDTNSCTMLGLFYYLGKDDVEKDYNKAAQIFKKTCSKDMKSCLMAGGMYQNAIGVDKDSSLAVYYYKKACDDGSASGCNRLGVIYKFEIKEDDKASLVWQKACNNGYAESCNYLGNIFYEEKKDYKKAAYFYEKACNGGVVTGCIDAASLYYEGKGVVANNKIATKLFYRACENGDYGVCKVLNIK